ncbi:unnamed protein product [Pieris macdunnoughi]|uniref:Sodium-coupled monocarboxylate transporter 1 n=1 Tax=Pieris macdunnoughi TaxID=345717 RepID=A0A821NMU6_9NEOP|nr:unnamed protein product [Pieris macdunnoughi]
MEKLQVSNFKASLQHFSWIDYWVFVLLLSVCGGIGIYFGFIQKQSTPQEYLMGGRKMKLLPVCFSLVASFISGISLLGIPTELYVFGTSYFFTIIGTLMMSIIISNTFLPVLFDLKLTSAYEYLQLRFDKRIRVFGSILFTTYLLAWLPIVIYVPALAFNQVTGVNIHIVSPIVCLVCIFYTSVGGLKAVVWTDVIQTIVMIGAMILVIVRGTMIVGGFGNVIQRNWNTKRIEFPPSNFDLTERHSIYAVTIGATFHWIGNIAVNQSMMQRFLALSDLNTSKKAVWGFFFGVLLIMLLCGYSGMLAYARYYDCDPLDSKLASAKDQLLPLLVMDVLGDLEGMPGVFVAGVFSAALSSLSTGLNSMAAVVLEDFCKPFFKELSQRQTQILVQSVVVIFGCLCVGLVFVVEMLGPVLQLAMTLCSASMGPLTGIFLMGLFLPFIDGTSALFGGLVGIASAGWIAAQSQLAQAHSLLVFKEKQRLTYNCTYEFEPASNLTKTNGDVPYIYSLSHLWLTALGCTVTIIVGSLLSLRERTVYEKDEKLFSPVLRKWITNKRCVCKF